LDTHRTDGEAPAGAVASANDPVFAPVFEPVRRLVLDEGASLVPRQNQQQKSDELWLGDAFDPLNPQTPAVPVYVRVGQSGALVAELVCGCIARALKLPAPEVFLIVIPPGHLPQSVICKPEAVTLCVGTRDIGGTDFTQLLSADFDAALPLLTKWPDLENVIAFDEWLANPDRNMGNLIYVAQNLHIIDHAEAFGGSCRELFPLAELTASSFSNLLADMFNDLSTDARASLLKKVRTWLNESAGSIDVQGVVSSAPTRLWNTPEQDRELVDFITQRLTITHSLLCSRLGHPQLSLRG
jgi:hypothetical protein